jgi:hypothetical protein
MHVDTAPPEYCISTRKEKIDHLPNRRSLAGWYSTKRNTRQPAQPNRNTLRCSRSDFSPLLDDVDGLALLPFGCVLNVRNRHHWNPIGNTIVFAKNAPQRLTFLQQYGSVKVSVQYYIDLRVTRRKRLTRLDGSLRGTETFTRGFVDLALPLFPLDILRCVDEAKPSQRARPGGGQTNYFDVFPSWWLSSSWKVYRLQLPKK